MTSPHLDCVTLAHAFEAVGLRIFGDEWLGVEIDYARGAAPPKPEDVDQRQAWLITEIERVREQLDQTRGLADAAVDDSYRDKFKSLVEDIQNAHTELVDEQRSLSSTTQIESNYRVYERYKTVWNTLMDALERGLLTLLSTNRSPLNDVLRNDPNSCRIYLRQSLGVFPRGRLNMRRTLLLVPEEQFRNWRRGLPGAADDDDFNVEVWCAGEINLRVVNNDRPRTKKGFFQELRNKLRDLGREPSELKERAFNRLWAVGVPSEWRKKGRKKKQSSH